MNNKGARKRANVVAIRTATIQDTIRKVMRGEIESGGFYLQLQQLEAVAGRYRKARAA